MQPDDLLKILNERKVQFLVVGAFAMAAYGHVRPTDNLNLWIFPSEENMSRAKDALSNFGYDLSQISTQKMMDGKTQLTGYWMDTIIYPEMSGITFETAWKNRKTQKVSHLPVPFPSLEDLIRMKQKMKRKQDKTDLETLLKIKRSAK